MTEATALRELKKGSQEALGWFIDRYGAYVSTVIYNIIGTHMSRSDVEEVASDVFFALWKQVDRVKHQSVKGYLGSIARNMAKNKLRSAGFSLPLEDAILLIEDVTLEERYAVKEAAQTVRRAVQAMKEPEREILLRFYYYFQTLEEISEQMDMNLSTVKTKLRRARGVLKTQLERRLT